MDAINSYVVSHEQSQLENDALREWELALALGGSNEKCCHSVNILNGVPVVPMQLASKESKSLVARLMDGARDRVYSLHRMILILYAPSVLARTGGTLTLKLINRDTGETILVASEHPVSQAATFVCRWPRAILANSAGLALLVATEAVDTKRGSLVGVLTPFWEDKVSTKMVYEKELPSLMYPLEEQEPAFYVKDLKRLRAVVASKVLLGGKGSDVEPQLISMIPPPPTSTGAVAAPLRSVQKSIAFGSFEPITVGRQRRGKVASGNLPSKPAVLASGQNQDKLGALL
nr:movement protein [Martellivirales sp.]